MYQARVIPCLLLRGNGLVKTRKFKDAVYIGDPVNAVRIFSDKEVDEIIILDIDASKENREPNYDLIEEIAGEAFMPMAYGGGIKTINQVKRLIRSGVEKVVINTAATESVALIQEVAGMFGSQAVVGAIDVRKPMFGSFRVMAMSGTKETKLNLHTYTEQLIDSGAGEIFINNIDRDGMMNGYDLSLIKSVVDRINVPVVACGGAGNVAHLNAAIKEGGASAVSAGSMFVFHGKHKAVLINYPTGSDIR